MSKVFKNKVAIITGASSGIGAEIAKSMAKEGAISVLVARTENKLLQVGEDIRSIGGVSFHVPTDISDQKKVAKMVNRVIDKFGRIDFLINNAGTSYVGEVKDEDFTINLEKMLTVDFLGTVNVTKAILPVMLRQNSGYILNMSSVVGLKSFARFTGYSSVMHAITGFTDGLRQELANTNIDVSIIHPALTKTRLLDHVNPEMMPEPFKVMTPMNSEQVAKAAINGIRKRKNKIIVPFQPKVLLLLNAISTHMGDWFVKLVSNRRISIILGMYKGELYHDRVV